jgi:hypothetical protein
MTEPPTILHCPTAALEATAVFGGTGITSLGEPEPEVITRNGPQ